MQFRIVIKSEIGKKKRVLIFLGSIIAALIVSGLFLAFLNLNPFQVYIAMLQGSVGSVYRIEQTIIYAIPLIITSLGVAIAFKMKFWNIGAEGQILMGAFMASYFALNYSFLPRFILLLIMFFAGFIGGAVWGIIPAFFRAKWGTNETIITLMMNYVALKWVVYLQYGPWKDPNAFGFPKLANFAKNAVLPELFGVHIGWIIAVLLTIFVYFFLNRSKKGFEIAVLGESAITARDAGINIFRTIIFAMVLSGGICGIVGFIEASGVEQTLTKDITGGVGYTAIIIAWLGALKPQWMVLASFLFAILIQGSSYIQSAFGISAYSAQLLEAIVLFFVLGSDFFTRYKLIIDWPSLLRRTKENGK
ncbi:MAG: ABC transporter permease [Peptococcaceae bacterium]|nr:ABC transporter permease [Peptococcaceae bacterium]